MQCAVEMVGFVCIPLQISSHPVQAPLFLGPHKLHSGNWRVLNRRLVLPVRSNVEDINGLAGDRVADIELWADVLRWASVFHKPGQCFLVHSAFEIVEGHVVY